MHRISEGCRTTLWQPFKARQSHLGTGQMEEHFQSRGNARHAFTMEFLKKLKMELPFDPVIPLLGLYPKRPKKHQSKRTYAHQCSQQHNLQ